MFKKMSWITVFIFVLLISPINIKAFEIESVEENQFKVLVKIFEPEDIYSEDYSGEEEVMTESAWINRAYEELRSEINYISEYNFDPPLVKNEYYDASDLDEGRFIIFDRDNQAWTFESTDNNQGQALKITFRNSRLPLGSNDEFDLLGRVVKTLDNSLTADEIYQAYKENFQSDAPYQIGEVKVTRDTSTISVERDLSDEIDDEIYPNYAWSLPEEQENDLLISTDIINQYNEEQANLAIEYHNQANQLIINELHGNWDVDYDHNMIDYEIEDIPNIFSEDYPEIENPLVNREYLNRILLELFKVNKYLQDAKGLYSYGNDSNTAYFYPGRDFELYMYSGIYDDRHLIELRLANNKLNFYDEILKQGYKYDDLFNYFSIFTKTLDSSLSQEEIKSAFDQWIETDEDFQLGDITLLKEGLKKGVLYLRRDLTDEIAAGEAPNYTESLANPKLEPLINDETNLIGEVENDISIMSEEPILDEDFVTPLIYSDYYSRVMDNFSNSYSVDFDFRNYQGEIVEINVENGFYIFETGSRGSSILIQVPEDLIKEEVEIGDKLTGLIRNNGIRLDKFRINLLPSYTLESFESFEIIKEEEE